MRLSHATDLRASRRVPLLPNPPRPPRPRRLCASLSLPSPCDTSPREESSREERCLPSRAPSVRYRRASVPRIPRVPFGEIILRNRRDYPSRGRLGHGRNRRA